MQHGLLVYSTATSKDDGDHLKSMFSLCLVSSFSPKTAMFGLIAQSKVPLGVSVTYDDGWINPGNEI